MRILVLGYIVRGPLAGHTWHHLQYVLGLARLGHDVYFLEDSDDFESCYDPTNHEITTDPTFGLRFARDVFTRAGIGDRWAYHDAHTATWHGPAERLVDELFRTADVVLNVSGVNPLREGLMQVPVRVFIDTDPAFTQVRNLRDPRAREAAQRHNVFLSFAENIGQADCAVPLDGLPWRPTRQPIVLDLWPAKPGLPGGSFSTMMQWQSYPAILHEGLLYGAKSLSFPPYFDLPAKVRERMEVAIGGGDAPRDRLRRSGWTVRDPMAPSADPWTYQEFIAESKAEFTVAKQAYVSTQCGWFSDRSAEYLATGRPVVTQQTGFGRWLAAEGGVLAYRSPEEAAAAIECVSRDYDRHCRAARRVAEEYFDSRRVLSSLLDAAATTTAAIR
ncbi:MAG TPA: hypothetical protein VGI19_09080 [Candidatus Cybelea sp.]